MDDRTLYKFSKPFLPPTIVRRNVFPRLEKGYGIIYLFAPTGYGKTVSVLSWIRENRYSSGWFWLDEYDNNLPTFCKGLLAALSYKTQDDEARLLASPVTYVFEKLQDMTYVKIPDVVVLDDLHHCKSEEVQEALMVIQKRLPIRTKLVILSWSEPPAAFSEWILKRNMAVITVEDLRFKEHEVKSLLKINHIVMAQDALADLVLKTGGWIIFLNAFLSSYKKRNEAGEDSSIQFIDVFYKYLKKKSFDLFDEDERLFLVKTSIVDGVTINYCREVLGFSGAERVFSRLSNLTGLVLQPSASMYQYHSLFMEFLRSELSRSSGIDMARLYYDSVMWLCRNARPYDALKTAADSNDIGLVNTVVLFIAGNYELDISEFVIVFTETVKRRFNYDEISKYPNLCARCALACFLMGSLEEMDIWTEYLKRFFVAGEYRCYGEALASALICSISPRLTSSDVPGYFNGLKCYMIGSMSLQDFLFPKKSFSISLTHNLPFFHKAQRDYGDMACCAEAYIMDTREAVMPFLGVFYEPLHNLLAGGLYYEKNDLQNALAYSLTALRDIERMNSPELMFCAYILYAEILFSKNELKEARDVLTQTRNLLEERNAEHLMKNLRAYEIRDLLNNGDRIAAEEWLNQPYVQPSAPICFYQCFQSLVTARALIVMGEISKALSFLKRLLEFNRAYKRSTDTIETLALISICNWKKRAETEALSYMLEAVELSQKYAILMPIIQLGPDLTFILHKLANRSHMSYRNKNDARDTFIMNLLLLSDEQRSKRRGFFKYSEVKNIRLSPKQKQLLVLLSENRTYAEIGEIAGIKITTVREHISRTYKKLEVSNALEAIKKAREMGLISMD